MDLAGGRLAAQRARGRCATVAVDAMVFHEPVFVGDEVSCYGRLVRTGRTSMTETTTSGVCRWLGAVSLMAAMLPASVVSDK